MELEIIVSYTKWRYFKIHRSGCYICPIFIDTSTDLCFCLSLRCRFPDSNILLLIWVCLRNGDVFAKQTTQCIELVQSNQSSWDCLSFAPLRCLESSSSASGNQSLGWIKSSIIFKQCVRLYSTVTSDTVKHFSSPNWEELVPGLNFLFSKMAISAKRHSYSWKEHDTTCVLYCSCLQLFSHFLNLETERTSRLPYCDVKIYSLLKTSPHY